MNKELYLLAFLVTILISIVVFLALPKTKPSTQPAESLKVENYVVSVVDTPNSKRTPVQQKWKKSTTQQTSLRFTEDDSMPCRNGDVPDVGCGQIQRGTCVSATPTTSVTGALNAVGCQNFCYRNGIKNKFFQYNPVSSSCSCYETCKVDCGKNNDNQIGGTCGYRM